MLASISDISLFDFSFGLSLTCLVVYIVVGLGFYAVAIFAEAFEETWKETKK